MALSWKYPKAPPQNGADLRIAQGVGTTGTDAATAGATDGLDCRGLTAVRCSVETAVKPWGTIRIQGMKPGDSVTVQGEVFTAVSGDLAVGAAQFKAGIAGFGAPDHGDDYFTALALAAAINADANINALLEAWVAPDEALITVQALADGVAGNAYTLVESTGGVRVVLSAATLAGGQASGGNIAANAALQISIYDPLTRRWNRAPDLDMPIPAGAASAALPPIPVQGMIARMQAAPSGVGFACNVNMLGIAGRTPA